MSTPRRASLAAAVALVLLVVVAAGPAAAHTTISATSPSDGEQLDRAPEEIVLTFNEPVSTPDGAVEVVDGSGAVVDGGDVEVDGPVVRLALDGTLPDGGYIATYRVIASDGHPLRGAFSFAVGDATPADASAVASASGSGGDRAAEVAAGILRWAAYLGALLAAGGALYRVAIDREVTGRWPHVRFVRTAAAAGAAAVLGGLPLQAHLATGRGLGSLFESGVASVVLGEGVGAAAAVTVAGLAVVAVAVGLRADAAPASGAWLRRSLLLCVGASTAVSGFAATGHANADDQPWLAVGADVVHLAAAAIWLGGLVLLARSLRARRRDGDPVAAGRLVARFSALATVAVLLVGAAGFVLGWAEVRSTSGLTGTSYGQLLLVKTGIVALIAGAGAYNRFRLVPALTAAVAGDRLDRAASHLRGTVTFEVVAMVAALAVTAVLVNVTPARAVVQEGPAREVVTVGDLTIAVVVDPPAAGPTTVDVFVEDGAGAPVDLRADDLTLALTLPEGGIGPLEREPERVAAGHHRLVGGDLSIPGRWEIEVTVRISRFEEASATVEVDVRPPGTGAPGVVADGGARTVAIDMVDVAFRPGEIEVEAGETIRFVFTNEGDAVHEAFVGDASAQREHAREMAEMAEMEGMEGMEMDDDLVVAPGETGSLTMTFDEPGRIQIGCHQPGHFEAGMVLDVEVS